MSKRRVSPIVLGGVIFCSMSATNLTSANELLSLFSQSQQSKFLPVHQAFRPNITQQDEVLNIRFSITPEHYIYQDKLSLILPSGITAESFEFNQKPTWVNDPTFGKVAVFDKDFSATAKLSATKTMDNQTIQLRWQGCAKAGLCYPPELTSVSVFLKPADKSKTPSKNLPTTQESLNSGQSSVYTTQKAQNLQSKDTTLDTRKVSDNTENKNQNNQANQQTLEQIQTQSQTDQAVEKNNIWQEHQDVANAIQSQFTLSHELPSVSQSSTNPLIMIGLLFLAGLLLAFTPCVYPMIPIVANLVARQKSQTARRGFVLSAAYGVGVATAYGALGAIIAWLGRAFGLSSWLQTPAVLLVLAALFVLFAAIMMDWVNIRLPSKISSRLQQKSQLADDKLGSISGSFLAGALSALVVSPCVSAPMAGALTAVSASGSMVLGFFALFALGLGLSIPLMIIGAAQGKWMPKAGEWMLRVKELGALMLLAVSALLVERVFVSSWPLLIWAVWFTLLAIWLYNLKNTIRLLCVLPLMWSMCLMLGFAAGATDAYRPLSGLIHKTSLENNDLNIKTLQQLDEILQQNQKVLIKITADWCVECRVMERTLFTDRVPALNDYQVVKLDITETTDDSQAVLARYHLFGPPALLIYREGKLEQMLLGEVKRSDFEAVLSQY